MLLGSRVVIDKNVSQLTLMDSKLHSEFNTNREQENLTEPNTRPLESIKGLAVDCLEGNQCICVSVLLLTALSSWEGCLMLQH